ncbi:MAG: hypothetical protein ABI569_14555 [Casimicrobiaceae bacterium]
MAKIDLSHLPACVEDSRLAWLDSDTGPEEPTVYADLVARLDAARLKLPPLYRVNAADPFIKAVKDIGADGFAHVLQKDPQREGQAGLLIDIAQAILQNGEGYAPRATDGFQEVISDLYDGFLSAEDRRGVKQPDFETIPPLVKWGSPTSGPYTWPIDATSSFGMEVGIVNLPPANARRGICAWAALGHETGGHDILHADDGLLRELSDKVADAVAAAKLGNHVAEYWADRIDETASDVLGILNLGPAAAVGVLAYFRGINASLGWGPVLSSEGDADDVHPADIVRGWMGADVVRLLKFKQAGAWADALTKETDRDAAKVVLGGVTVTTANAKKSAAVVAQTIAAGKLNTLDGHAFSDIQNWADKDDALVAKLTDPLTMAVDLPARYAGGTYAAHVVAAAVMSALRTPQAIPVIFDRMLGLLKVMHDANPSWGPLYVVHPGDVARDLVVGMRKAKRAE